MLLRVIYYYRGVFLRNSKKQIRDKNSLKKKDNISFYSRLIHTILFINILINSPHRIRNEAKKRGKEKE